MIPAGAIPVAVGPGELFFHGIFILILFLVLVVFF